MAENKYRTGLWCVDTAQTQTGTDKKMTCVELCGGVWISIGLWQCE